MRHTLSVTETKWPPRPTSERAAVHESANCNGFALQIFFQKTCSNATGTAGTNTTAFFGATHNNMCSVMQSGSRPAVFLDTASLCIVIGCIVASLSVTSRACFTPHATRVGPDDAGRSDCERNTFVRGTWTSYVRGKQWERGDDDLRALARR